MATICLINQKGGCGKSSTCFHLAGCFVDLGLRVLLIDSDPQGSLSQAFFGSEYVENLDQTETLSCLFRDDYFDPSGSLLPTPTTWAGLSIVCSNQTLAAHNRPSPETSGLLQFTMAQFLEAQRHVRCHTDRLPAQSVSVQLERFAGRRLRCGSRAARGFRCTGAASRSPSHHQRPAAESPFAPAGTSGDAIRSSLAGTSVVRSQASPAVWNSRFANRCAGGLCLQGGPRLQEACLAS